MHNIAHEDVQSDALEHFSLKQDPFNWLPKELTDYFYGTEVALVEATLWKTIQLPGICAIIGEVGCGKSSAMKRFVEKFLIPQRHYVVSTVDAPHLPHLDIGHICRRLLHGFVGEMHRNKGPIAVAEEIRSTVEHLAREGIRPVLIVEDAHLLGLQPLKELKLLYELRERIEHHLAIVLIAQPTLFAKLQRQDLRQLASRTAVYHMRGLSKDLPQYIKHRCQRVGASSSNLFDPEALKELVAHKAINTPLDTASICARSLNRAYKLGEDRVTQEIMFQVLSEQGDDEQPKKQEEVAEAAAPARGRQRRRA